MKKIVCIGFILPVLLVTLSSADFIDWNIKIGAMTDRYRDTYNFIGVSKTSSLFYDEKDILEPPPAPEGLSLYFPHFDWSLNPGRYAADYRPPIMDIESYEFVIEAGESTRIILFWSDIASAPEIYMFTLIDKDRNHAINMKASNQYTLDCNPGDKLNFKILVRSKERLRDRKPKIIKK